MLEIVTSPKFAAEKAYACMALLEELLGIPYHLKFQEDAGHYEIRLPKGATLVIEDHFFENQTLSSYLDAANIPDSIAVLPYPFEQGSDIIGIYGRPYYTEQSNQITCGIDLFASAFFMLSRWEEHVRPERDAYGRFPAKYALAERCSFLRRPVVNEYAHFLGLLLQRLGWNQPFKMRQFNLHLSHDVDHPQLWRSEAARLRTLAGGLLRGGWPEAKWWWRNAIFSRSDPFDTFDHLMAIAEQQGLVAQFNFMAARPGSADRFYALRHSFIQKLLQKIATRGHQIGFHPSRDAFANPDVFEQELNILRHHAPQPVSGGRQHYLCFAIPETWRHWASAGLAWESSLGYPEAEGFRCGICCEFPVFDILSSEVLPLREKPLIAMDVTLAQYRHYAPEQAFDKLQELRRQVEKHQGEFVLLWHNSSWNTYFWAPWQEVYRNFVAF